MPGVKCWWCGVEIPREREKESNCQPCGHFRNLCTCTGDGKERKHCLRCDTCIIKSQYTVSSKHGEPCRSDHARRMANIPMPMATAVPVSGGPTVIPDGHTEVQHRHLHQDPPVQAGMWDGLSGGLQQEPSGPVGAQVTTAMVPPNMLGSHQPSGAQPLQQGQPQHVSLQDLLQDFPQSLDADVSSLPVPANSDGAPSRAPTLTCSSLHVQACPPGGRTAHCSLLFAHAHRSKR